MTESWQTSATNPVEGPLPAIEAKKAAEIIEANRADWAGSMNEDDANFFAVRNLNTKGILAFTKLAGQSFSNQKAFIYKVNNVPVGVMLIEDKEGCAYVESIVSHPLSQGCGGALMEAAVRYSKATGKQGHVKLLAADPEACKAYLAMGFTNDSGSKDPAAGMMTLKPTDKEDVWADADDTGFSLKKHAAKSYATGFEKPS